MNKTYDVFIFEFRRDLFSKKTLLVGAIFVIFTVFMLMSIGYMMSADVGEGEGVPEIFIDPDEETWANLSVSMGSGLFYQLLGVGAACYFGAGALARDMKSGTLRLVQSAPVSRESTYLGRNFSVFLNSYLLAVFGSIVMTLGMLGIGVFNGLDITEMVPIILEQTLKIQLLLVVSIFIATTTTAVVGTYARSQTIAAVLGISFFILIDSFLAIGIEFFPTDWHLENLSFKYHQQEIVRWLIGNYDLDYHYFSPAPFPSLSILILFGIPIIALITGILIYRTLDLD